MAGSGKKRSRKLYVGVDVGGTKILATLVKRSGKVLARRRLPTPREGKCGEVVEAVAAAIEKLLHRADTSGGVAAVGLAIPGVVDPDRGRVVITPNMNLTGLDIVKEMRKRIDVPVALGNDVNLGTLGEKWLGAGRGARSAVGIFLGTGIGGGVIIDGAMYRGCRESAGEVGHLIMQPGGPLCGCGSRGCFEALASRTAIERDIRAAVASGRKSVVTELLEDEAGLIRSGTLKKAIAQNDEVVVEVMRRAAEITGYACLSIRHLIDPEVIILGGGVIEACGDFMLPIIEEIVASDPLTGARPGGRIVPSLLGDDAVA
ncbi:MAG: ROK family protein, partial [Phycisphaerae bacterium]